MPISGKEINNWLSVSSVKGTRISFIFSVFVSIILMDSSPTIFSWFSTIVSSSFILRIVFCSTRTFSTDDNFFNSFKVEIIF